jgi:hypothetical protein
MEVVVSLKYVHEQIDSFIASDNAEVLCIQGAWGVGKTYAWDKYLREAKLKRTALKQYSYVTLFGMDSLQELKYSVFENSVLTEDIGVVPTISTLNGVLKSHGVRLFRYLALVAPYLPWVKNYVGGFGPLYFLMVNHALVCFDDLERKGKNLSIRDVLGLVSLLKERKQCKVVLILNNDSFDGKEGEDFDLYYEKVVDRTVKFDPTPQESVSIALSDSSQTSIWLSEFCIILGITNIRVIKKIESSIKEVEKELKSFAEEVLLQAARSLAIFGWSIYERKTAPPVSYLEDLVNNYLSDEKLTPQQGAWNAALDACGFSFIEDFDRVLLNGIQNGFFDKKELLRWGTELDKRARAKELNSSFDQAWRMFHDSFEDNQEEVLDAIYKSFNSAIEQINPGTLGGTVVVFKELGRAEQAAQIIQSYVSARNDPQAFNVHQFPEIYKIIDPDVLEALESKFATFKQEKTPLEHLKEMMNVNGWSNENLTALADLPVEKYREMFKSHSGDELPKLINACLQFDKFSGGSPQCTRFLREHELRSRLLAKRILLTHVE